MSNPRPPRTRAQEEAAEWLARLGDYPISTQTVRDFRDWRDDPDNDAAYEEAEAFWEANGQHASDPEIMRMTQAALDRGKRRSGPRTWWRDPRTLGAVIAASLAVGAGAVLGLRSLPPSYETQAIEQKVVRLPDGSRVHLNIDSQVRVVFRDDERRLELTRGEAFFDVAHDARRPFVVRVAGAQVRALGTKFDVRRQGGGVQVTLVQGLVRVTPDAGPDAAVTLQPNQQASLTRGAAIQTVTIDAQRTTSWTTGRLIFRDTPLAAAAAEVNRYSAQPIELAGAGLDARPVSGLFDVGDAESFARGVADFHDLALTRTPTGAWRLTPGPAASPSGS